MLSYSDKALRLLDNRYSSILFILSTKANREQMPLGLTKRSSLSDILCNRGEKRARAPQDQPFRRNPVVVSLSRELNIYELLALSRFDEEKRLILLTRDRGAFYCDVSHC